MEIAPLDYERYAVLVSPLLVPGAGPVQAKPPARAAGPAGPVSVDYNRAGPQASRGPNGHDPRLTGTGRRAFGDGSTQPASTPRPPDGNWFFQLPNETRESIQDQPAVDPRKATELYEHQDNARGATVRVSGVTDKP